jgi:hypothetical protein
VYAQATVTDVDMKTMYCVKIHLDLRDGSRSIAQYVESVMPRSPELKEIRNELSRIDRDIKRMQDYLMTRARIVGASTFSQSVMAAANRGDADIATQRQCREDCGDISNKDGKPNVAKLEACEASCKRKIGDVLSRAQSCYEVNWLPF